MKKLLSAVTNLFKTGQRHEIYAAGQIWKYKTRDHEKNSRLYIVRVDRHEKLGNIYHIYVDGLNIKNPMMEGGIQYELPHSPVNEITLNQSLVEKIATTEKIPDISDGYNVWKEAFDSGNGGVFNIPVIQIIECVEDIIQQNS